MDGGKPESLNCAQATIAETNGLITPTDEAPADR